MCGSDRNPDFCPFLIVREILYYRKGMVVNWNLGLGEWGWERWRLFVRSRISISEISLSALLPRKVDVSSKFVFAPHWVRQRGWKFFDRPLPSFRVLDHRYSTVYKDSSQPPFNPVMSSAFWRPPVGWKWKKKYGCSWTRHEGIWGSEGVASLTINLGSMFS